MQALLAPDERLRAIDCARRAMLLGEAALPSTFVPSIEGWITRSWQRCLAAGQRPRERVSFEPVGRARQRERLEGEHALRQAARPVLDRISRAIAATRYFAMLTDAQGTVVDVGALPEGGGDEERQARAIARVGVDLSERAVGTTAIGAALAERRPVWLHRGEHFFDDNGLYSCAGAPVFGAAGGLVGMLDLTGIGTAERPELAHLAVQAAQSIQDALVQQGAGSLLLHLGWPGAAVLEGLVMLDGEGRVTGANASARQMLNHPLDDLASTSCEDLFAAPPGLLFDAARRADAAIELPLWSGLRVQVRPRTVDDDGAPAARLALPATGRGLREVETALIHRAVQEAQGNVARAARTLGISRATVYRKLRERGQRR